MFEIIQAVFVGGAALALFTFAGITLGGSTLAFALSTPLVILFCPVLVPATVATTLLVTGLTAAGSLGAMALTIVMWLYKQYKGMKPPKIPGLKPAAPKSKPASSG